MDGLHAFLKALKHSDHAKGNFLGILHVLVGRRITDKYGNVISHGLTWRETAEHLKKARWDREAVRELGIDPQTLPPRQRDRFWYAALSQAQLTSDVAALAGDRLAKAMQSAGYVISSAPRK